MKFDFGTYLLYGGSQWEVWTMRLCLIGPDDIEIWPKHLNRSYVPRRYVWRVEEWVRPGTPETKIKRILATKMFNWVLLHQPDITKERYDRESIKTEN